jgi:FkbM family methyltransferase
LPVGFDLVADISRIRPFASLRTVVDVGANVGDWTLDHLDHAPGATFYCFEPSADTYATLSGRMARRARVRTFQAAVGGAPGTARLYHIGTSVERSLHAPVAEQGDVAAEDVPVLTLDGFAVANGLTHVDLLKSDTEGFDGEVLAGARGLLQRQAIDFIFVEVNFSKDDAGHSDFDAIAAQLGEHGYRPIGFYDVHLWGPLWFVAYLNVLFTCL